MAIVAPSILGQFSTTIEQVYGAFKQIGFTDVIEVAQGAMETVENEAHELIEKLEEGQKFMTTSCCPSYIELVNKYIPDMKNMFLLPVLQCTMPHVLPRKNIPMQK